MVVNKNLNESKPDAADSPRLGLDPDSIYPTPKTFEQRREDNQKRDEMYRKRLPKHPYVGIVLFGLVVFGVAILLAKNIGDMWQSGSLGAIFFSFAWWLGLMGLAVGWVIHTSNTLYSINKPIDFYWINGAVIAILTVALSLGGWFL